ncbi:MAG: flagellar biosynthesis protein FlhG [Planctomycetota bacterium]
MCVVSGKGGTGKSLCTASLANLLSRRGRTLIMDADLGVGNAHLLQNVHPEVTLVDVVEGNLPLRRAITPCGDRLDLLAGGSGYARVAHLSHLELEMLARGLERMECSYDYLVVDSAAGLSEQTVGLAAAADLVVLVTTPDITSLTDAYAFLKVLVQLGPARDPLVVINRVQDPAEAEIAMRRMSNVASKFLGRSLRFACVLPEDRAAFRCTQRRMPVSVSEPESALALALGDLGREVLGQLDQLHPAGIGRTLGRRLA